MHNGEVTLLDCIHSGAQINMPGYVRQKLWIDRVLIGGHVKAQEGFDEIDIQTDHLIDWHRRTGLRLVSPSQHSLEKWQASYVWPEQLTAEISGGAELQLALSHTVSRPPGRLDVVERSSLLVRSPGPASPKELFTRYAAPLRDFPTTATLTPAVCTKILVRSSQHARQLPNGKHLKDDLELRGRFVQPALQERVRSNVNLLHQLFAIEDHPGGFGDLVTAWSDLYPRAKDALDLYLGLVYQPPFWFPNKVATLAQALEAYHRLVLPQPGADSIDLKRRNDVLAACPDEHREWLERLLEHAHEPSLRTRLTELVERVASPLKSVFKSSTQRKRFVNDLGDARNLHAHPGDRSRPVGVDLPRLYAVYQRAKWVFLANVLVDLQFPEDRMVALLQRDQDFSRL
jgi:hypothetical protein